MSAERPGLLRRTAYRAFRIVPSRPSHAIIRLASPTYSLGAIAIVEHDGRILALEQTHRRGMSLPGGLVDRDEQPAEAVVREVREETGLRIESGDIFATIFDVEMRHVDVIFRIECDRMPHVAPASEATGHAWLDPSDWGDEASGWGDVDRPTVRILEAFHASHAPRETGRVVE